MAFWNKTPDEANASANASANGLTSSQLSTLVSAHIDPRTLTVTDRLINSPYLKPRDTDPMTSNESRRNMIGMRLRLHEAEPWPWPFFETHATEDKVFVFLVVKDQPVTLEDDKGLFPSDTLITQLRLLE